jgi:hypothetical protein
MIIILILLAVVVTVGVLYYMNLIPNTGGYMIKKYKLPGLITIENEVKSNIFAACDIVKTYDLKSIEDEAKKDKKYFTFNGMKSFSELSEGYRSETVGYAFELCAKIDENSIMKDSDYKEKLEKSGLNEIEKVSKPCDEIRKFLSDNKVSGIIVNNNSIIEVDDYLDEYNPSLFTVKDKC